VRAIWTALERVEDVPEIGHPTTDPRVRQIVVGFGRRGYVVRYRILPPDGAVFVTRLWHGREARK
jgi:plasmid stabilization system protein ParE